MEVNYQDQVALPFHMWHFMSHHRPTDFCSFSWCFPNSSRTSLPDLSLGPWRPFLFLSLFPFLILWIRRNLNKVLSSAPESLVPRRWTVCFCFQLHIKNKIKVNHVLPTGSIQPPALSLPPSLVKGSCWVTASCFYTKHGWSWRTVPRPPEALCAIVLKPAHERRPKLVFPGIIEEPQHANAGYIKITEFGGCPVWSVFLFLFVCVFFFWKVKMYLNQD